MPTPSGSLNLTDMATLGHALGQMTTVISTLQDLSHSELPRLSNDLQSSVSGMAVQDQLSHMGTWTSNTAAMVTELQSLYNYLAPIYAAASGTTVAPLGNV